MGIKVKFMKKEALVDKIKQWWNTDCPFCKKTRLLLLWLVVMLVTDYLWFHLLF